MMTTHTRHPTVFRFVGSVGRRSIRYGRGTSKVLVKNSTYTLCGDAGSTCAFEAGVQKIAKEDSYLALFRRK